MLDTLAADYMMASSAGTVIFRADHTSTIQVYRDELSNNILVLIFTVDFR